MKNMYTSVLSRWLFTLLFLSCQALLAQTAPTIQWQKTINIPYTNTAIQSKKSYVAKASGGGYAVATIHNRLLRLSDDGTTRWQVDIPSSQPDLPGLYQVYETAGLLAMQDGGFVVLTADAKFWSLARFDANGKVVWVKSFDDVTPATGGNVTYFYKTTLIQANDGGFIVGGYEGSPRGNTTATIYSFSPDGTRTAKQFITFYDSSNVNRSLAIINKIVPAFDGGYIAVGYVTSSAASQPLGWAVRVDNKLNVLWQNTYALVGPLDDIIQASDGQNYLFTGITDAVIPSYAGIRAIDGTGQLIQTQRSDTRSGDTYQFSEPASISSLPNSSPAQSVLFTTGSDNSRSTDFRLTTPNLRLSLGGTNREVASNFITTDDGGFLLVGTTMSADGDVQGKVGTAPATWIVKLKSSSSSLTIAQPFYDCQTGNIRFQTNGGDGSSITFTAPGVTRSNPTSIVGIVEQGLRNDPKIITVTATQNGYSTSYNFDLKAACTGTTPTPTPTPTGGTLTMTQPTYNCSTGAITFNSTGGDGSPITYTAPGITRSSATSNTGTVEQGLRNDPKVITITAMQSGQMTSYSFDLKAACSGTTPTPTPTPPATGNALSLSAYVGNCASQTPLIAFKTTGGDGTPITFSAPGVVRRFPTDSSGTIESGLRNDPKPITISALQSGKSVSYVVDLPKICDPTPIIGKPLDNLTLTVGQGTYNIIAQSGINFYDPYVLTDITGHHARATYMSFRSTGLPDSLYAQNYDDGGNNYYFRLFGKPTTAGVYTVTVTATVNARSVSTTFTITVLPANAQPVIPTPPATGNTLTLTVPTYNCSTGAFTFNYTGGNGSPVEFQAAGITGWTTNPNQFVDKDSRTANDVKPFMLMARQNGQVVTYTWDLKAACGRSARMAATEAGQALELTVKGNPVGNTAVVEIRGVEGQALQLDLFNASGHVLEQRHIEQAGAVDEQHFDLQRQPTGLLFLRAQSGQQKQTVKLIKQ